MARSQKITHDLVIHKSAEKGSAYLLIWSRDTPMDRDPETGVLVMNLDTYLSNSEVSAWTTLSHAKRHAASKVGRSRMAWETAPSETGDVNWNAKVVEKVAD